MYAPGFDVDPDALGDVASSVLAAVEGAGAQDVADAVGGAADFGHDGLHAALTALNGIVAQTVAVLQHNASALAQGVTAAAGQYLDQEASARQALHAASALVEGAR